MQFKCQNSSILNNSVYHNTQSSSILPINRTLSGSPTPSRVDLGDMVIKGYTAFLKAPALLEPHHQIV